MVNILKSSMILAAAFAAWYVVSTYLVSAPYYLPSPELVARSYREPMLWGALATIVRTIAAFSIGTLCSYFIFGAFSLIGAQRGLDRQFAASRAIPMIAATPLFILWFGFGESARLLVVTLTVIAFSVGPLAEAALNLPREQTIVRERLSKSRLWEFANVVIPGTLPAMIGPLRISFAIAFTTSIALDFMGASSGIGRAIDTARVTFNVPAIFLLLILSAAIGVLFDTAIQAMLNALCHWRNKTFKG